MAGQIIFIVSNINIYIYLGVFKEKEVALLLDDAAIQTKYADYYFNIYRAHSSINS